MPSRPAHRTVAGLLASLGLVVPGCVTTSGMDAAVSRDVSGTENPAADVPWTDIPDGPIGTENPVPDSPLEADAADVPVDDAATGLDAGADEDVGSSG